MLKDFRALPTEARAENMTDRDYLYCIVNEWLDGEDRLAAMCPECRARAEEKRCIVCGERLSEVSGGVNGAFDGARYERMSRGCVE